MKLVIAGASVYGLKNVSDDSMLQSFLGGMRETVPGLEVTLICRHLGEEVGASFDVRSIQNLDFPTKEASVGKRFHGFNAGDSTEHLRIIKEEIATSDALMIGGDPFDDSNSDMVTEPFRGIMPYVVNLITLAKYLQKKIILHGIHLGRRPTSAYGTALTKFCVDNADIITTREDDTKSDLIKNYGALPERVVSSADSGFALLRYAKPAKTKRLEKLFSDNQLQEKSYIALTARSYYWLWNDTTSKSYAEKFAAYVDRLAAQYQCKILLLPHCAYELDNYWESDINFQREIYQRCKSKDSVVPIDFYLTSEELLYCIEQAKFVVSNRRHSGIYASLLGVPFCLFGERGHVGKVYTSLGITPKDFIDERSLERMFADAEMKHLSDAFEGWDAGRVKKAALAQEKKCTYAIDAICTLLNT